MGVCPQKGGSTRSRLGLEAAMQYAGSFLGQSFGCDSWSGRSWRCRVGMGSEGGAIAVVFISACVDSVRGQKRRCDVAMLAGKAGVWCVI
eukprot:2617920-Pleurochrysis_carterae.AAC.1